MWFRSRYGQRMSEKKTPEPVTDDETSRKAWQNVAAEPQPYLEVSGELEEPGLKEVAPLVVHVPGVVRRGSA
jgi:hypothetical protein